MLKRDSFPLEHLKKGGFRRAGLGLSLLELGLVIAIVSLALVPVVQMISGARSQSGEGTIDRITGIKSKEAILANALVEQALSGDFSQFNCNSQGSAVTFNENTDFPTSGGSRTYNRCSDTTYQTPLYYQWTLTNVTGMPQQNEYYKGTFNVYDTATASQPILTLPAHFFRNTGSYQQASEKIGIMLALDVSGSMSWGKDDDTLDIINGISSPFMYYRYDQTLFTGNSWGTLFTPATVPGMLPGTKRAWLNKWSNSELDMSYGQSVAASGIPDFTDPDTGTDNNEKFPYARTATVDPTWGNGLLGTGNCSVTTAATWTTDINLIHSFILPARNDASDRTIMSNLCKSKTSDANWGSILDNNMSRIEAARTGALALLLNLEQNPNVISNIELGFIPWSTTPEPQHLVSMETAQAIPSVSGLHFKNLREKLLWINRADPSNVNSTKPIQAIGGTAMRDGLAAGLKELMSKNYDRRILILLTDGEPTDVTPGQLQTYVETTFGNKAAKANQVTLFTVGLIGADASLMNNLAKKTPDGQSFTTNDLRQLRDIFESISYQIQKLALISAANRYGIEL